MVDERTKLEAAENKGPIVHFLYEPGAGGLDRVAILLANGMAERGIDTELWLTRTQGPLSETISDRVVVRRVPAPGRGGRGLALFLQIPGLARMLRRHAPRAIFSAGNQSNLSVAIAKHLSGRHDIKIVQKITNPVIRPGMTGLPARLRTLRFERTALAGDRTLCLSDADAKASEAAMPRAAGRFRPVHNAYVTDEMLARGLRRPAKSGSQTLRLLSVGRLAPQKDHATLLRALARLERTDWSLELLGDGKLRRELEELANVLGIDKKVNFLGFADDPAPFFAKSDFLVLSSRWEGMPAVPLEALACGCQVIATDCSPGLTEVLHECGQAIVPIGDVEGLALAIDRAIVSEHDRERRRRKAAEFSIASSIDDHLDVLAELGVVPAAQSPEEDPDLGECVIEPAVQETPTR